MIPRDHARLAVSVSSISSGAATARNAASSRPSVAAIATIPAVLLSANAVAISSLEIAGRARDPGLHGGKLRAQRRDRRAQGLDGRPVVGPRAALTRRLDEHEQVARVFREEVSGPAHQDPRRRADGPRAIGRVPPRRPRAR